MEPNDDDDDDERTYPWNMTPLTSDNLPNGASRFPAKSFSSTIRPRMPSRLIEDLGLAP